MKDYETLKQAIWEFFDDPNTSFVDINERYNITKSRLHRAFTWSSAHMPAAQPSGADDIQLYGLPTRGGQHILDDAEENLICEAIKEYVANRTPLDRESVAQLTGHLIELMP
ncbi:hypothetical protein FGB62_187g013 [Gracilaria domingensis]|nr:hypothetical protein FGB62_187g013 [Gracilaria domingensis]